MVISYHIISKPALSGNSRTPSCVSKHMRVVRYIRYLQPNDVQHSMAMNSTFATHVSTGSPAVVLRQSRTGADGHGDDDAVIVLVFWSPTSLPPPPLLLHAPRKDTSVVGTRLTSDPCETTLTYGVLPRLVSPPRLCCIPCL